MTTTKTSGLPVLVIVAATVTIAVFVCTNSWSWSGGKMSAPQQGKYDSYTPPPPVKLQGSVSQTVGQGSKSKTNSGQCPASKSSQSKNPPSVGDPPLPGQAQVPGSHLIPHVTDSDVGPGASPDIFKISPRRKMKGKADSGPDVGKLLGDIAKAIDTWGLPPASGDELSPDQQPPRTVKQIFDDVDKHVKNEELFNKLWDRDHHDIDGPTDPPQTKWRTVKKLLDLTYKILTPGVNDWNKIILQNELNTNLASLKKSTMTEKKAAYDEYKKLADELAHAVLGSQLKQAGSSAAATGGSTTTGGTQQAQQQQDSGF